MRSSGRAPALRALLRTTLRPGMQTYLESFAQAPYQPAAERTCSDRRCVTEDF